jgi:hypothetical protein
MLLRAAVAESGEQQLVTVAAAGTPASMAAAAAGLAMGREQTGAAAVSFVGKVAMQQASSRVAAKVQALGQQQQQQQRQS